jgi:tetratricopeptide (TPR) repeat protein
MREVPYRVARLFTHRAVLGWWVAVAALGVGLTWLPLLGQPGYELSMGLTLTLAIAGAGLSIAAARTPGSSAFAAAVLLLLSTGPALLLATLRTWLGTPCNPFSAVGFVPVLLVPTAGLVAVLGAWCAKLRGWRAGAAYAAIALGALVPTLWPILAGPQVYAFHHLGGYVPGPLYDEELTVTPALLWFRLATVLLTFALGAALQHRWLVAALLFFGFVGLEASGTRLGFRMTDAALAAELGGKVETDELILFHPASWTDEDVSLVLGDVRFRHHQNVEFFGAPPPGKVRVWWYRSAADKQRLVGAKFTHFAKPWRREVHVHGAAFPHPVIKHELVHAMAAPWGAGPFGVAATWGGFMPHVGVIEGLAVAADDPIDELTLHEWAAAMKKKALLPNVAALMTPQGFYGAPPSRAYTTAGSFLRWLGDSRGKDKLRRLYLDGDFDAAFGAALPALASEYEAFLDTVPLEPEAVNQAFGRFKRGSLFDRPCAREVGALSAEASAAEPLQALELLSRCRAIQPDEPSHVLAEAQALRRLSKNEAARVLLDAELTRLEDEPAPWADAALLRADLAQEDGDLATASALWNRIIERQVSPALDRTAHVRLDGKHLEAVRRYFAPGAEDVKLYLLREALEREPNSIPLRYLLARKLTQSGEAAAALPLLEQLLGEALPASLQKETARLAVEAAFHLGRCDVVQRWATRGDWPERCAFAYPAPAK